VTPRSARVLVVEDEETLRHYVARGLAKMPGVEVTEAGTLAEAIAAIDAAVPDVVLSDLDLPDRPGIELIGELGSRGLRPALTFVSAYARAFAAQIPRFTKVRVLEKPVSMEKLREVVRADLEARGLTTSHASAADAAPFGVPDYLQIACLGRHSVVIAVDGPTGSGQIVVHGGVVWSAQDASGRGEAAFARLALASGARVACRTMREAPGDRNIDRAWEALLLDAARVADEEARTKGPSDAPAPDEDDELLDRYFTGELVALPPVEEPPPAEVFGEAVDRGTSALLAKKYPEAMAAFLEAERVRPGDRTVLANLARLRQLGIAEPAPAETTPSPDSEAP